MDDLPGGGVRFEVHDPAPPRLRVEIAAPGRFWLRQDDRPVLLAHVERSHYGVHYMRLDGHTPVLPPLTAAEARREPSWPHHYVTWLAQGPGPLHPGWWTLQPWRPPGPLELAAEHPSGYLDWFAGWNGIVPLRPLPEPGNGRVKAHRKLVRDGLLPPILLWWVSGLDGWVLLDGHARLAAALAEDTIPPALALALGPSPSQVDEMVEYAQRGQALVEAQLDKESARRAKQWHFADVYAGIPGERLRTRAWPLPEGGSEAWQRAAPPGWPPPDD
ncbi:hypothetical protein [Actinomadura rugatobispora]|uniref:ParB/Sulfiredoxin domain-containing protein n=1 Tax=Actinomadura rugatobispora TaxID=1994 RepID=A0ABW0ZPQ8_9ACTN|nr:hypothetical protein GCM10010200_027290 [Actinomadura rugatobispora]